MRHAVLKVGVPRSGVVPDKLFEVGDGGEQGRLGQPFRQEADVGVHVSTAAAPGSHALSGPVSHKLLSCDTAYYPTQDQSRSLEQR